MGEFRMPSLGAGMDAGKLLEWRVQPGDEVHRGDIVALVETDKAAIEVEIFEDGTIEDLVIEEGNKVPVGTVLAHVSNGEAAQQPEEEPIPEEPEPEEPEPEERPAPRRVHRTPYDHHEVVSPLVRHLARERHVDLSHVRGTGHGGVITRDDVEHAAAAPSATVRSSPYARVLAETGGVDLTDVGGSGPDGAIVARDVSRGTEAPPPQGPTREEEAAEPPEEPVDRHAAMRQAIARAMATSNREIPHYYLGQHVDLEETLSWLEDRNADLPPAERILPAALLLKATALACVGFPDLNGFWVDDAYQPAGAVHLGVAISLRGGGLVAPAIHDADQRSLEDVMAALKDLVKRARAGRLRGSEVSDPTITVTNLGDQGVGSVYGIIYPRQVALVGTGRIQERPWAEDGMVGVRRVMHLTLAGDHRASDGHRGGLFLADISRRLQQPEAL